MANRYEGLEMGRCSACLEPIPALAVKCRYCGTIQSAGMGKRLEDKQDQAARSEYEADLARRKELKLEIEHVPKGLRRTFRIFVALHNSAVFEIGVFLAAVALLGLFGYAVVDGIVGSAEGWVRILKWLGVGSGVLAGVFCVPAGYKAVMSFILEHLHLEREDHIERGLRLERSRRKLQEQKNGAPAELKEPGGVRMVSLSDLDNGGLGDPRFSTKTKMPKSDGGFSRN